MTSIMVLKSELNDFGYLKRNLISSLCEDIKDGRKKIIEINGDFVLKFLF